jgi:hypothetical protein
MNRSRRACASSVVAGGGARSSSAAGLRFRIRSPESILAERSGAATRGRERLSRATSVPVFPRTAERPAAGKAETGRGGGDGAREIVSRSARPAPSHPLDSPPFPLLCTFPTEGTRQSALFDGSRLRLSSDRAGGCRSGRASSSGVSLSRQEALHETQRGGRARNGARPKRAWATPSCVFLASDHSPT